MECCGSSDNGIFGVGAVGSEHLMEAGNAITWLELEYIRSHSFDDTSYIVSSVEGLWFSKMFCRLKREFCK